MLNDDADARLFDRLDMIDASLAETRVSIDGDRDARRATEAALNQKIITAKEAATRSTRAVCLGAAALALAVILGLVGLLSIHRQQNELNAVVRQLDTVIQRSEQEQTNQLVVNCINGNASRAQIEARVEKSGTKVMDALGSFNPPTTPEAVATRQQALDQIKATYVQSMQDSIPVELKPRDCSVEGVTNPTLVTTPPAQSG